MTDDQVFTILDDWSSGGGYLQDLHTHVCALLADLRAEVDRLRVEVERLEAERDKYAEAMSSYARTAHERAGPYDD